MRVSRSEKVSQDSIACVVIFDTASATQGGLQSRVWHRKAFKRQPKLCFSLIPLPALSLHRKPVLSTRRRSPSCLKEQPERTLWKEPGLVKKETQCAKQRVNQNLKQVANQDASQAASQEESRMRSECQPGYTGCPDGGACSAQIDSDMGQALFAALAPLAQLAEHCSRGLTSLAQIPVWLCFTLHSMRTAPRRILVPPQRLPRALARTRPH